MREWRPSICWATLARFRRRPASAAIGTPPRIRRTNAVRPAWRLSGELCWARSTIWKKLVPGSRSTREVLRLFQVCHQPTAPERTHDHPRLGRNRSGGPEPLFHLALVDQAGLLRYDAATTQDDEIGYAADIEARSELRIFIRIDFQHHSLARHAGSRA